MITIIHGEDTLQSHNFLFSLLQRAEKQGLPIIKINPQNATPEKIATFLENDLFGQKDLLLFHSPQKLPLPIKKQLFSQFSTLKTKHEIIFFSEKTLNKKFLKNFPQANIRYFKPKAIVFYFLDAFGEKKKEKALKFLTQISKQQEEGIMLYFLAQRLEDIFLIKTNQTSYLHAKAPWQKEKLAKQAQNFSLPEIENLLIKLTELDYQQKTGQLPYPLVFALELLINKI